MPDNGKINAQWVLVQTPSQSTEPPLSIASAPFSATSVVTPTDSAPTTDVAMKNVPIAATSTNQNEDEEVFDFDEEDGERRWKT